jgi:hypothetical protein
VVVLPCGSGPNPGTAAPYFFTQKIPKIFGKRCVDGSMN